MNIPPKKTITINFSQMDSGREIITRWAVLFFIVFIMPVLLGFKYVIGMFSSADFLLYSIAFITFITCALMNFKFTFYLARQFDILKKYRNDLSLETAFGEDSDSLLCSHMNKLEGKHHLSNKSTIRQDTLIETMHVKLKRQDYVSPLASNLLITFGLVGTIVGLITTMTGLETAVGQFSNSETFLEGVKSSLSGMGTAFYTTLVGAVLGGITLRVLHSYTDNKATMLVAEIAEVTDVRVLPLLVKQEKE
jgi:hypothetical protein